MVLTLLFTEEDDVKKDTGGRTIEVTSGGTIKVANSS
jgi:hypothetical protein